jgi:glycolate oxidase FAD binding subunit
MRHGPLSLDNSKQLVEQVRHALAHKRVLRIRGGDSKHSLGRVVGVTTSTRARIGA